MYTEFFVDTPKFDTTLVMKDTNETWPPVPMRPEPAVEADPDGDDWLTANNLTWEVTWRDYAIVCFAAVWLMLACFAIAVHHHLPPGAIKDVHQIIRTVSS